MNLLFAWDGDVYYVATLPTLALFAATFFLGRVTR